MRLFTPLKIGQQLAVGFGLVQACARLLAEDTPRTSEARFRALTEQGSDLVSILTAEGAYRYASPAHERLLGRAPAALVGQDMLTVVHPDDRPRVQAAFRAAHATPGTTARVEFRLGHTDGTWRWVEAIGHNLLDDPAVGGVVVTGRDVTDRKEAEAALAHLARRHELILTSAGEGIYGLDREGRVTFVNPAATTILGYAATALIGRPLHPLLHHTRPDGTPYPAEECPIDRAMTAGTVRQVTDTDAVFWRADGTSVPVEYTATPLCDDGRVVGVVVTFRDITERVRAERAVRTSEARLRTVVANAPVLLSVLDRDGVFTLSHGASREPVRLARADLIGQSILALYHDNAAVLAHARRALAGDAFTSVDHVDDRVFETYWSPLVDAHGHPDGTVVVGVDITARVRAEEATHASEARLRALIETAPVGVCVTDAGGAFTMVNAAYCALYGYTPAELLGQHFTLIVPAAQRAAAAAQFARGAARGVRAPREIEVITKAGQRRTVLSAPTEITGADGRYRLAFFVVDLTERQEAAQRLTQLAHYDALTGLPNRVLFDERLQRATEDARRDGAPLALLLLDLDRFKEVNDTRGHPVGDVLLRQVADRLRGAVRATDSVARLGGDEFTVLLPGADAVGAARVARDIGAAFAAPFAVGNQAFHIGGSVGIALCPAHGADGTTLLRHADVAMYAAKRGRLDHAVYDPAQDQHSAARLALVEELRAAIERGALALHYQPQVDLTSGRVCGVEALVRWPHPERGLIPPDAFIPLAEQTGLIAPLTEWVLAEAVRQARAWQRAGLLLAVSVNLSMWNLHDPALPARVAGLLREHGLPPAWLRLELTESVLMADAERALDVLTRLSGLGVRLAVDDFGAGYSSLAYLKKLPVDELKIDQGFVRALATDATDAAIVASTVALGHALGLRVVAEGIEDRATWDRLVAMGCDVAQGYYMSRPLPADALARWLRDSPWAVA